MSVVAKKIAETPDFVRGLLKSADEISNLLNPEKIHPRVLLQKLNDVESDEEKLGKLSPEERQELGVYRARVVLVVLAVELALKFLWEQDKGKPAKRDHKIQQLFNELSPHLKVQIRSEYSNLAKSPPNGWETPDKVFDSCKGASVQWRYLVEESNFPNYVMQANYLKHATLSVLLAGEKLPEEK